MEGVGRLGRASSRYGPTTVFTGPVRKWKKRWVHVSASTSTVSYQNSHSNSQSNGSRLLLCRWTPVSPTTSPGDVDNSSAAADEPPRRKFRYTPIVELEEQKLAAAERIDVAAKMSMKDESITMPTLKSNEPNTSEALKKETQQSQNNLILPESNISHLDLGLGLKGQP